MKMTVIDGNIQTTPEAVHAALAAGLDFPEWYGANLDALHDCLTDLRDAAVLLRHSEGLGPFSEKLRRVLADSATENPHFLFVEQRA